MFLGQKESPKREASVRSPLNSDSICDAFWMRKRQNELNETIKKKKIGRILNDWNRERILRESNQTFFRNRASEHGIFFGKVVYQKDYLDRNMVSQKKFQDDFDKFKRFANFEDE